MIIKKISNEDKLNEPLVSVIQLDDLDINNNKYKDYVNVFYKYPINKNNNGISLLSAFDENKDIQYHLVYI